MTEDFYDLLDVPPDASQDRIRKAFREQVRVYHPDLNDDDRAQAQFTALKTAYDVLGDPSEREVYDRLGHVEYVAKRTSGLPSPEKWQEKAQSGAGSVGSSVSGDSGSRDRSSDEAADAAAATGSEDGPRSSAGYHPTDGVEFGTLVQKHLFTVLRRLARWWRSLNVAGPLLWLATAVYVLGLVRYGRANGDAIASLREALLAAGPDVTAISTAISSGTRNLESVIVYVTSADLVTPPLGQTLWYGMLGVVVVGVIGLLVAWRLHTRGRLLGPVTIDETIVLALALGGTSSLVGGPLLAGALLLPLLYGVVIYHSRQIPGWSPTYLYLLAVSAPACGLMAGWLDLTTVPIELLAFVVVPLLGAFGLPIRFNVRRRFGI